MVNVEGEGKKERKLCLLTSVEDMPYARLHAEALCTLIHWIHTATLLGRYCNWSLEKKIQQDEVCDLPR